MQSSATSRSFSQFFISLYLFDPQLLFLCGSQIDRDRLINGICCLYIQSNENLFLSRLLLHSILFVSGNSCDSLCFSINHLVKTIIFTYLFPIFIIYFVVVIIDRLLQFTIINIQVMNVQFFRRHSMTELRNFRTNLSPLQLLCISRPLIFGTRIDSRLCLFGQRVNPLICIHDPQFKFNPLYYYQISFQADSSECITHQNLTATIMNIFYNDIMNVTFTCNGSIFRYGDGQKGSQSVLLAMIYISAALLLYLLYKMFKLCQVVFSYSNFHIHQTYKLYALGLLNLTAIFFSRKSQIDLMHIYAQRAQTYENIIVGYEVINNLFAVLSIFTNNYMHLYNAFTWLLIAMNCDFTLLKQSQINRDDESEEGDEIRESKNKSRKRIRYLQNWMFYLLLPALLVFSIFGTLKNTNDLWCEMVKILTIISGALPLLIIVIAVAYFSRKFADSDISILTKAGLVYLLITTFMRSLYFLVLVIKADDIYFGGDALSMIYFLTCTLAPILCMSVLSDLELKNEQFTLLRKSNGSIFRSTII